MFVIPIQNQYEQANNTSSLNKLGINSSDKLEKNHIQDWVNDPFNVKVNYPDNIENIIKNDIIKKVNK
ncbi:hypothetical protein [Soonwooa purpurea]